MMGAGAAYASNPNVPNWSPYAVMAYESNGPTYVNPGHGDNYGYPPRFEPGGMGEGRAAIPTITPTSPLEMAMPRIGRPTERI
jgi:hypothetical protein